MGNRPPLRRLSESPDVASPGLAFVTVSPKAWAKIDSFDSHSFYFNLKAARKTIKDFRHAVYPSPHLDPGAAHARCGGSRKRESKTSWSAIGG